MLPCADTVVTITEPTIEQDERSISGSACPNTGSTFSSLLFHSYVYLSPFSIYSSVIYPSTLSPFSHFLYTLIFPSHHPSLLSPFSSKPSPPMPSHRRLQAVVASFSSFKLPQGPFPLTTVRFSSSPHRWIRLLLPHRWSRRLILSPSLDTAVAAVKWGVEISFFITNILNTPILQKSMFQKPISFYSSNSA